MKWVTYDPPECSNSFESLNLTPVIEQLLGRLGIEDEEAAERFLYPKLSHLTDPDEITNMSKATERIREAIIKKQSISILGDYDVDGITSSALLIRILTEFGADPTYWVPRRMEEGYGVSKEVLDRMLLDGKPDLFIALDCGTNSVAEIAYLRGLGIDVIIVDHHQSTTGDIPSDCVLINPHILDDESEPWYKFCTVGLVFKLVHSLVKLYRSHDDDFAKQMMLRTYLDIVAIGTVADLVLLTGENRILTSFGLRTVTDTQFRGIHALCDVCKLSYEQSLKPNDVSFRIGPRINASGRLADASLPIEMFLSKDYDACLGIAKELDQLNTERRKIEQKIVDEAESQIEQNQLSECGLVVYSQNWHPGVVGIVAGKLCRVYSRPCLVLGDENGLAKGSVRSVNGINIIEILEQCSDYLSSWGGHPMAAGVSLDVEKIEDFSKAFSKAIQSVSGGEIPEPSLEIALWIEKEDISDDLLEQLDLMQPYGQGNSEPIFGIRNLVLGQEPNPFGKDHFKFRIPTAGGSSVEAIAWRQADHMPQARQPIDVAIRLGWNVWNGRRYIQVELVDWRESA